MDYIELAWRRDASGLTHIDDRIQQLLGYSAQEMKNTVRSITTSTPWMPEDLGALACAAPNAIVPHTFTPCPLRHKCGHEVLCEVVLICRYDGAGDLAELFGMVRNYPCQEMLHRFLHWWIAAGDADREAVCGLADLLASR